MDRQIEEYRIVNGAGDFDGAGGPAQMLEEEVRALIAEGWEVQGGVGVAHGVRPRDDSPYFYLFQAMVRREQPPKHDKLVV